MGGKKYLLTEILEITFHFNHFISGIIIFINLIGLIKIYVGTNIIQVMFDSNIFVHFILFKQSVYDEINLFNRKALNGDYCINNIATSRFSALATTTVKGLGNTKTKKFK